MGQLTHSPHSGRAPAPGLRHRLSERGGWLRSADRPQPGTARGSRSRPLGPTSATRPACPTGVALLELVDQVADRKQRDLTLERPQPPPRLTLGPRMLSETPGSAAPTPRSPPDSGRGPARAAAANSAGVMGWPSRSGTVMTPVGVSSNAIPPACAARAAQPAPPPARARSARSAPSGGASTCRSRMLPPAHGARPRETAACPRPAAPPVRSRATAIGRRGSRKLCRYTQSPGAGRFAPALQPRLDRGPLAHTHRPSGEDVVPRHPGLQPERDRLPRTRLADGAVERRHLLGRAEAKVRAWVRRSDAAVSSCAPDRLLMTG